MAMEMGVERNVGSVATHTCISGYRLLMQDGGNTRTCSRSGWSGQISYVVSDVKIDTLIFF